MVLPFQQRIDSILENLARNKEWGGHETIVAVSELEMVTVEVYFESSNDGYQCQVAGIGHRKIAIVHRISEEVENGPAVHRNHYDSVVRIL